MHGFKMAVIATLLTGCNNLNTTHVEIHGAAGLGLPSVELDSDADDPPELTLAAPVINRQVCLYKPPKRRPLPKFPANEIKAAVEANDQRTYDQLLFQHTRALTAYIQQQRQDHDAAAEAQRKCSQRR